MSLGREHRSGRITPYNLNIFKKAQGTRRLCAGSSKGSNRSISIKASVNLKEVETAPAEEKMNT